MTLAGISTFNGLFIHNNNLLIDIAYNILTSPDWTFQFYYASSTNNINNKLVYINDNSFIINLLANTNELQIVFKDIFDDYQTINLGVYADIRPKCYTFIKTGEKLNVLVNEIIMYTNITCFADLASANNPEYICIFPTIPNNTIMGNFVNFYNIALTTSFISQYYQYVFPNNSQNLLINIRGDQDYTSYNHTIERDLSNSAIVNIDVCAQN